MPELWPIASPSSRLSRKAMLTMSNDPLDRYSRAESLRAQRTKLLDDPYDHDSFDGFGEKVRVHKNKAKYRFKSYDLADENLDLLPARSREAIEMLLRGHSVSYVAEDMGASPDAIEKLVRAARRYFDREKGKA